MLTRDLVKLAGGMLLAGAMLVVLPACGGTTPALSAPKAIATDQQLGLQAPAVTAAPAVATAAASLPATPVPDSKATSGLLGEGKLVFEKTAGGVGCAYCHGPDGKGGGQAGQGAPDIRGRKEVQVRNALTGGVPLMSFIKLSDKEIDAVVAYLQYLN